MNHEQDILHINQNRFKETIKQREQKNDQVTKFYSSKDSPVKTLALANYQKDNDRNAHEERQVAEAKKKREEYELGIIKQRKNETNKTKVSNLQMIDQKLMAVALDKDTELKRGIQDAQ